MGLFSRKKIKVAGLANSRVINTNDMPRALIDSRASYVQALAAGNNFASLLDYRQQGKNNSIVARMRKMFYYVKSDYYESMEADSTLVEPVEVAIVDISLAPFVLPTITDTTIFTYVEPNFGNDIPFGEILPNLLFQVDQKDIYTAYKEDNLVEYEDLYYDSKKYAKKLGIKYNHFFADIYEDLEGEDKQDIHKAYITFGIPMFTGDEICVKYIYEYFSAVIKAATQVDIDSIDNIEPISTEEGAYRYEDKYTATEYSWANLSYHIEDRVLPYEREYQLIDGIDYYKQISETQCICLKIDGYNRRCYVNDGTWAHAETESINTGNASLLVPFDRHIWKDKFVKFKDREELAYRSIYLEFLSFKVIKQKWYQTLYVKIVLAVTSAVMNIFAPGSGAALLSTAGFVVALAMNLAINYIIGLVINLAINLMVKIVGGKAAQNIAIAVAVITVAYGGYKVLTADSGTLLKTADIFFKKATVYLKHANNLFNQATQRIGVEFDAEMREKELELQELKTYAESMLQHRVNRDMYSSTDRNYISSLIYVGYSVDQIMYNLTNYNKIAECVNYIYTYPEDIISLPTLSDSTRLITGTTRQI